MRKSTSEFEGMSATDWA